MNNELKFTFVTYCDLPILDADDRLVQSELEKRGHVCQVADWRDSNFDWDNAGICVIRSTWDYHLYYAEFQSWLTKVSAKTTVWNAPSVVRWNSDKRYLNDLAKAGIPIVPTRFFTKDNASEFESSMESIGWHDAILKPSVGLSTFGVHKIKAGESTNQERLAELLRSSEAALLQPYIDTVLDRGERAFVFLGGRYSHAIRKSAFQPLAQAGEAGESVVEADPREIDLAHAVLNQVSEKTAFARVDLIRDRNGEDLVMELELVEPSLYLGMVPSAVEKFADVLCGMAMN